MPVFSLVQNYSPHSPNHRIASRYSRLAVRIYALNLCPGTVKIVVSLLIDG